MSYQQQNLESGMRFVVVDADALSTDLDLRTAYPGYNTNASAPAGAQVFAQGATPILPRLILFTGGDLVLIREDGGEVTLTEDTFGGISLPLSPAQIKASGSTATAVLVIW